MNIWKNHSSYLFLSDLLDSNTSSCENNDTHDNANENTALLAIAIGSSGVVLGFCIVLLMVLILLYFWKHQKK